MTTVQITINTDNAAFDDNAPAEFARILRRLASEAVAANTIRKLSSRLADVNGNTTGFVKVKS